MKVFGSHYKEQKLSKYSECQLRLAMLVPKKDAVAFGRGFITHHNQFFKEVCKADYLWQQSSTKPENRSNFAYISQWAGVANKKVAFACEWFLKVAGSRWTKLGTSKVWWSFLNYKTEVREVLPTIGVNPILEQGRNTTSSTCIGYQQLYIFPNSNS